MKKVQLTCKNLMFRYSETGAYVKDPKQHTFLLKGNFHHHIGINKFVKEKLKELGFPENISPQYDIIKKLELFTDILYNQIDFSNIEVEEDERLLEYDEGRWVIDFFRENDYYTREHIRNYMTIVGYYEEFIDYTLKTLGK